MVTQYMSVANRYTCTVTCHLETVAKTEPQAKDYTNTGHSRKVTYCPLS